MKGGDALVRCLELEGVRYITGFAGGGLNVLFPALRASETIKVFATRHERLGVEVADGYARNYLIPKQLAQQANSGIEAQAQAMRKAWSAQNAKNREAAEEVATTLVSRVFNISA